MAASARRRPSSTSMPRSESASRRAHASRTSSVKSGGPSPRTVATASRISSAFPTAAPRGWSMSVSRQTTSRPARRPSSSMVSARIWASSSVFMKAPSPTFTSSTIASAPEASFFDMMLAAISGTMSTVPVTSRSAYRRLSAGTRSAVWPMMASPTSRTCAMNSSVVSSTRKPGMDSSLSSVPPVWPSPRPLIFPTGTPQAATIGPTAIDVLSPTPPVECLSTTRRPSALPRSSVVPLLIIASVSADVRELALVRRPVRVPSRGVREQERMLPRVVRRGRRRIAAVVGREDEQVSRPERLEDVLQPAVEVLQAAVEVDRVVAVAPEHVRLDQVDEHERSVLGLLQEADRLGDALHVRLRRVRLVDPDPGEDVVDLADAVHLHAGVLQQRQVVRRAGLDGEVVPVRRARVVPRLAGERAGDHASDLMLAGEDLARGPARLVELLERDRLLVRGDLEDGVGRGVDDPLARLLVLLAELLDDLRPGGRLVAEHSAAGLVHERVDHVVRKAVRVGRERLRRDDPHQLPVPGRRVLALRALGEPTGDRRRAGLR